MDDKKQVEIQKKILEDLAKSITFGSTISSSIHIDVPLRTAGEYFSSQEGEYKLTFERIKKKSNKIEILQVCLLYLFILFIATVCVVPSMVSKRFCYYMINRTLNGYVKAPKGGFIQTKTLWDDIQTKTFWDEKTCKRK